MLLTASIITVIICLGWVLYYLHALRQLFIIENASELSPPKPSVWPKLSVIVPARNEEDWLETAMSSLLSQNYPNLEVIAVNDRSTDATGEILDKLREENDRLKVVHIEQLPDNWLGKTHALHRGVQEATGDWLLFTDADVRFQPGALRQFVAIAVDEELDHLSCLPHVESNGFLHEVATAGFFTFLASGSNLKKVHDPKADDFIGVGAFNLVRKDAFDRTEGFEWIRMDTVDDMALAYMMQRHQAKSRFVLGTSLVQVEWYPSLSAMARGTEKNGFAMLGHYRWTRVVGVLLAFILFYGGPIVGILIPVVWSQIAGTAVLLAMPVFGLIAGWRQHRQLVPSLFLVVGMWFVPIVVTISAIRFTWKGKVEWRDTSYSLEKLREYQRAKM